MGVALPRGPTTYVFSNFHSFTVHLDIIGSLFIQPNAQVDCSRNVKIYINLLTPNVNYSGRTAPLTSKFAFCIFIQQI